MQVAVCDECGSRLLVANINKRYRAYYCGGRRLHGIKCDSRPYVRGDILEPRLVREIEKVATDPGLLAMAAEAATKLVKESSSAQDSERQRLRSELSGIERQWAELGQALANGTISSDMISACDRTLQSRKRAIAARLEQIESAVDVQTTAAVTRRALLLRSQRRRNVGFGSGDARDHSNGMETAGSGEASVRDYTSCGSKGIIFGTASTSGPEPIDASGSVQASVVAAQR